MHRMILNETSWFGRGSINQLTSEIENRGYTKAFIVTDKNLVENNVVKKITELLDQKKLSYYVFDKVIPNPTIDLVKLGISSYKESQADYIIAIGGGSPQDTSKAIGIVTNNPEFSDILSLEGTAKTRQPSVPIIAIPTTAGTAAEVTINYVITDEENKRKFVCVDPHCIPKIAIIDADMMEGMPPALKAATGVDALTHAIEGYVTLGAWELTDTLHLKSIEIISNSLRNSVKGIAKSVEDMGLGQYVAGMGFSNVGLGLVHGMAHPLGAFYNTPHGVANAVLLPYVMRYNASYTGDKYRFIALAMGLNIENLSLFQIRNLVVDAIFQLNQDLGIPRSLQHIGVKKEDISALAHAALVDVCTSGNPRKATLEDIVDIYTEAF
ncbi:Lactaldehyde reductase [Commensalibacter sp. Nvir]|uniref:lactaldehyde reductase n=1 Tax=Commensalibacter sp. Nvir TaxID=3069817 RepID=UPI002D6A2C6A|nr:Lactaldehyde reductase [Commensalibacter sp. Nvir]